jgi:hypothetical protein
MLALSTDHTAMAMRVEGMPPLEQCAETASAFA